MTQRPKDLAHGHRIGPWRTATTHRSFSQRFEVEQVQVADLGEHDPLSQVHVYLGGRHLLVSQKALHGVDVGTARDQMGRKAVTQRVHTTLSFEAGQFLGAKEAFDNQLRGNMAIGVRGRRKEPVGARGGFQIIQNYGFE